MATDDVRSPVIGSREDEKKDKQQLAKVTGYSAIIYKYRALSKREKAATTIYCSHRRIQAEQSKNGANNWNVKKNIVSDKREWRSQLGKNCQF